MGETTSSSGHKSERHFVSDICGVLFVHGIGNQRKGQTLLEFGGGLYDVLDRRVEALHQHVRALGISPDELLTWFRVVLDEWMIESEMEKARLNESGAPVPDDFDTQNTVLFGDIVHSLAITLKPPKSKRGSTADSPSAELSQEQRQKQEYQQRIADEKAAVEKITSLLGPEGPVAGRVELVPRQRLQGDLPSGPAHAELNISWINADGSTRIHRWLLAESWWSQSFHAPTYKTFARWAFGVVPWVFASHFGARIRRLMTSRSPLTWLTKMPLALVYGVFGFILAVFITALLTVVLVLAAIPIEKLRDSLMKFQLGMTSYLGDCAAFASSPLSEAAILKTVIGDLEWLEDSTDKTTVVAHSQGAAVAFETLRRGNWAKCKLLVTLGSGLKKLSGLKRISRPGSELPYLIIMTFAGFFAIVIGLALRFETTSLHGTGITVAIAGAISLLTAVYLLAEPPDLRRVSWIAGRWSPFEPDNAQEFMWYDLYASSDPVSNGDLETLPPVPIDLASHVGLDPESISLSYDPPADHPEGKAWKPPRMPFSSAVCNMRSLIGDHMSYWKNKEEFGIAVASVLARASGRDCYNLIGMTATHASLARKRREGRVKAWSYTRGVFLAIAAFFLFKYRKPLEQVWAWLGQLAHNYIAKMIPFMTPVNVVKPETRTLNDTIAGVLIFVLGAFLIKAIWHVWNISDMHRILGGRQPYRAFEIIWGLSFSVPIMFALHWFGLGPTEHVLFNTVGPACLIAVIISWLARRVTNVDWSPAKLMDD